MSRILGIGELFKLFLCLAEVLEAWGGPSLDPAGRRVPVSVEGQGCTVVQRPGEGMSNGRDRNHNSSNATASCPTCARTSQLISASDAYLCRTLE